MFVRIIHPITILIALGFCFVVNAQALAEDDSLAELMRQIGELYQQGKYNEAISLAEKLVVLTKKARGPEDPETATSLNNLAVLYREIGDYAKAEPLFKEALRIRQKVLGPQHPDTAQSLNNLAALYKLMGDYAKAEPLYKEALEICQKVLGSQHPNTAKCLNNLALLYQAMGDYAKAEPLLGEALEICQKVLGPQDPSTATSLNNLAELYRVMGECGKAEPLYEEALEIRQRILGREHPLTAQSMNNLALLYFEVGDYAKAEPLYEQALQINQIVFGREDPNTAASLSNLAELYQDMGDYAKAEPLLKEALEICRKVLGQEHPDTAQSLSNLAVLYEAMGDLTRAEPPLREALEIRQKVLGQEHPDTATSLNNLAELYVAMGDYTRAETLHKEALEIHQKVFGREHLLTATSLNNLAALYRAKGEYARAEPLYKEALEIDQKILGPKHPETARSLEILALLELDLGKIQEARRISQLAYSAGVDAFSQILSFGSEDQRLAYQRLLNPYTLFVALGNGDALLADAVLHYKGVVLDSIIEDRLLAETGKDEANRHLVEQLRTDKRTVNQLSLQTKATSPRQTIERMEALEQEVENIEDKLARQITNLGQARRALTITVEQVQAAIPDDAVLVEYVKYLHYLGKYNLEWRYVAILLSRAAPPRWVALADAQNIETALRRYQDLVRARRPDADEMAALLQKLYHQVWEPVELALPASTKSTIISPDGQLNFLSFATLLDADKHFMAEKYSISYVASGRDLLRSLGPIANNRVIVLANPKFDQDLGDDTQIWELPTEGSGVVRGPEKRDFEDLHFDPLDGTQTESDELIAQFKKWGWQATSLTGTQVTKQALLDLHSLRILHLATHGFFEPEYSSGPIDPAPFGMQSNFAKSKFFKNPMNCSGLALAEANSTLKAWKNGTSPPTKDDGILTAEDVSAMDLKGSWLVTLSACDTGSGQARAGEGVMGLRRGFIEAGAQNLLMTLWSISDEVTVQIMSDFYDAAHKTGNAPEAFAEVQREWLVQLRDGKGPKFDKVKDAIKGRGGLAKAVNLAGPFIMSSQGKP